MQSDSRIQIFYDSGTSMDATNTLPSGLLVLPAVDTTAGTAPAVLERGSISHGPKHGRKDQENAVQTFGSS